eukprot:gene10415-9702_t
MSAQSGAHSAVPPPAPPVASAACAGSGGLTIFAARAGAATVALELPAHATAGDLRAAAAAAVGRGPDAIRVLWRGDELRDPAATLADAGLCAEAVVELAERLLHWPPQATQLRLSEEGGALLAESTADSCMSACSSCTLTAVGEWASPVFTLQQEHPACGQQGDGFLIRVGGGRDPLSLLLEKNGAPLTLPEGMVDAFRGALGTPRREDVHACVATYTTPGAGAWRLHLRD